MGKEAKIGLAVILVLLITFGVVLGKRLSDADKQPSSTSSGQEHKSGAGSGTTDLMPKSATTFASSGKATVVASKPALTETTARAPDSSSQWNVVSDSKTPSGKAPTPTLSYMPDPPTPATQNPSPRYASTAQYPSAPPMIQSGMPQAAAGAAGGNAAYDPFHGQTPLPGAGVTATDPSANPVRTLASPPAMPAGVDAGSQGPSASPYGNSYRAETASPSQIPTLTESSRYEGSTQLLQGAPALPIAVSTAAGSAAGSLLDRAAARTSNGEYEVQPNDNYWTISERLYGAGSYFRALAEHNRNRSPQEDQLAVGDVISAPAVEELEKNYPDLCPKPSRREAVRSLAKAVSTRLPYGGGRTYVVQKGDTLYDIARYELGKASRWAEIHALNADLLGKDYDYLVPGTQLTLPQDGAPADAVTRRPGTGSVYQR